MPTMRKSDRDRKLKFLKKWFKIFDEHFFEGYFKDKHIKILIDDSEKYEGLACKDDREIIITTLCLTRCKPNAIRETLLHEMIHLFVAFTFPKGYKKWDDGCRTFKDMERSFQKLREEKFERK